MFFQVDLQCDSLDTNCFKERIESLQRLMLGILDQIKVLFSLNSRNSTQRNLNNGRAISLWKTLV